MTVPIDLECPACKTPPGSHCTLFDQPFQPPGGGTFFHHCARVDAAREDMQPRGDSSDRLRKALRRALEGWLVRDEQNRDVEARLALYKEFDL